MLHRAVALSLLLLVSTSNVFAKEKFQRPGPVHLDRDGEKWAEKTLHKLSLEEKVGQLFMVWVRAEFLNVESPDLKQLLDTMHKYHLGSFCMTVRFEQPFLYRNQPYEAAVLLNHLQKESPLPLLIAADFERGVPMRLYGATVFPHAMAFGAAGKLEYARSFGSITAQEARAIGVQWNFFPDADLNSNPANPVINTRSFGEDPQQVGDLVAAYIEGARSQGMLTTAKHFPGHGDAATDSHLGLAQITADRARLDALELAPFRRAVQADVDAIMVAHVSVPALEPNPNLVATTSPAISTDLLQKQLGFKGIVVSDALEMAGLTRLYSNDVGRAAVEVFKAGNDMLIIPADLDASYRDMLAAARSGEIPAFRIDQSVLKILRAKASVGLHKAREVDLSQLNQVVGKPENLALGQEIADDAVTVVKDNGAVLPLKHAGTVKPSLPYQHVEDVRNRLVVVIFSDDVRTEAGRELERQVRARVPDVNVLYVDGRIAAAMSPSVITAVDQAQAVVLAVSAVPVPGRMIQTPAGPKNSVSLPDASGALVSQVLDRAAAKTVVVALGNPYLAQDYPALQNYVCTFSNVSVSETAAVKALFGEIAVHGHLPVNIPGVASRGAGLDRPALVSIGGSSL